MDVAYPDAVLTRCVDEDTPDDYHSRCQLSSHPVFVAVLGHHFHVEKLPACPICKVPDYACQCSPQRRTAYAHAQQQAAEQRIRAKTRRMEEDLFFGPGVMGTVYSAEARGIRNIAEQMGYVEPSDPGSTIPPQLDP